MDLSSYESKNESIKKVLKLMIENVPQIKLLVITSIEGLLITYFPEQVEDLPLNPETVAGFVATQNSLAEKLMLVVGRSNLLRVFQELEHNYLITVSVGTRAVLTAVVRKPVKITLIFFDMKTASEDIDDIINNP
ncbi:MAG: roadblock/LC7 domain-containing protein [Candidatus Odinarchaeota archaeon]